MSKSSDCDVLVVGGGVAGLAATSKLIQNGITNVVLLEAQNRLGGRVSTYREGKFFYWWPYQNLKFLWLY